MTQKTDVKITVDLRGVPFINADEADAFKWDVIGTLEGLFLKQGVDYDPDDFDFEMTVSKE